MCSQFFGDTKMLFILLGCLIFYVTRVYGSGEFLIAHSPKSLRFEGDNILDQSLLPEIFSSSLGFTIRKGSQWQGLSIQDPFNYAEAVVILAVEGINSIGHMDSVKVFPLHTDQDEEKTWRDIKNRVIARFPTQNCTLLRIDLSEISNSIDSFESDKGTDETEEIFAFSQELKEFNKFIDDVHSNGIQIDGVPDVYWFVLHNLHTLADLRGLEDPATIDAINKVKKGFTRLAEVFTDVYQGRVLVASIVSDASHTRRTRSLLEDPTPANDNDLNFAEEYDEDYPAIFNIILWFMIAFVFSLIAISIAISTMDPGRDSIIYRMTSNKMKKDN